MLKILPEVADALADGLPVVALETTILSFGLPRPRNLRVGRACEAAVRAAGAVPATLAILNGDLRVGLTPEEVEYFCDGDPAIRKVNPSNFAAVLAQKQPGALTVAACLMACRQAGIGAFATGGIGGVHRGYAKLPDISADLTALAAHPVVTVCAGAKSILDLPATLEALETLGVPVLGWRTNVFPRFHTPESLLSVDARVDSAEEAAAIIRAHRSLGSGHGGTGVLVAAPVPAKYAMAGDEVDRLVEQALAEADVAGVRGRATTPFLLQRLEAQSEGRTLDTNEALVVNNCGVAAEIAAALCR